MRNIKFFLLVLLMLNLNSLNAGETEIESKITKNLRCLICQGQSVYDSDSEFALSLKIVVKDKIKQGLSEQEIYDFLKSKYGEWILYDPLFGKNTYFLWLLPLLIFLIGGAIIIKKLNFKEKSEK
tara:strand:- start:262 stop:636 length:375 start_codon:yes stop_codon:yes gene_type:complete